ncbi:FAD-dependent monooxygenase [Oscillatoria amoena NRMC-F 0135]|nr:FAD-dependent monooxygenase [Oscillatoria amoena NRMC-F 0135]
MQAKELILSPEEAFRPELFNQVFYQRLGLQPDQGYHVRLLKRSIDARGKRVIVRVLCEIVPGVESKNLHNLAYPDVTLSRQVIIVGSGPAGLFAALRLIELGVKPVIIERGSDVRKRRRDLAAINKHHIVNPESNYCFGEGGAGTYSDGKLYTRSKKRGDVQRILNILVAHGAHDDILYDAHPHIGTNKLPVLVEAIRNTIRQAGGEIHFDTKVVDLIIKGNTISGVRLASGDTLHGEAVILATGHSARDIYETLHRNEIAIEVKPFALGVRIEHPQELIDRIQYHCKIVRDPYLPASSYALVHQAFGNGGQRGVFSFCMCPGGFIVPAATAPGEVVVNGMSPSRRDSKFANSGIVVAVESSDFQQYGAGPLSGMYFQAAIERQACLTAGGNQTAPAQRLVDFLNGKVSDRLNESSYQPGLSSIDLHAVLPPFISNALKQGFKNFGRRMKGYVTNEAQVVGVESRTSSPVRIPRTITLEHPQIHGLYPCGEGAGYAGGIVSAAIDGERCAEAIRDALNITPKTIVAFG